MVQSSCFAGIPFIASRFINHTVLINSVYPTHPGEEGPVQHKLSYLLYYATARPAKLTKIGAYMEKKLAKDIQKQKKGFVKITLTILDALIDSCYHNLNLFTHNIVNILIMLLSYPDDEVLSHATITFARLCSKQDNLMLGLDAEYYQKILRLLKEFCGYCYFESSDVLLQSRKRLAGLRSIQGLVFSKLFTGPQTEELIALVVPAALFNKLTPKRGSLLSPSNKSLPAMEQERPPSTVIHPTMSIYDEMVTPEELDIISSICLKKIAQDSNASGLKSLYDISLNFLDEKQKWVPSDFALDTLRTISRSVQPRYRHIFVSSLIQRFNTLDNSPQNTPQKITLLHLIIYLLYNNRSTVGVSVLELMETFIKHLSDLISQTPSDSNDDSLELSLIRAIASLSACIHYPNQLTDLILFLINKLRIIEVEDGNVSNPSSSPKATLVTPSTTALSKPIATRKAVLKSLHGLVKNYCYRSNLLCSSVSLFPVELLNSICFLMLDADKEIRLEFCGFMYYILKTKEVNRKIEYSENEESTESFSHVLLRYLGYYADIGSKGPSDYISMYCLWTAYFERFGEMNLISIIANLLKLEASARELIPTEPLHHVFLCTMVSNVLVYISEVYESVELQDYLKNIQMERKDVNDKIINLSFNIDNVFANQTTALEDFHSSSGKTSITAYLNPKIVVKHLIQNKVINDQHPRFIEEVEALMDTATKTDHIINEISPKISKAIGTSHSGSIALSQAESVTVNRHINTLLQYQSTGKTRNHSNTSSGMVALAVRTNSLKSGKELETEIVTTETLKKSLKSPSSELKGEFVNPDDQTDHLGNVLSLVERHLKGRKHDRLLNIIITPHNVEEVAWFDSFNDSHERPSFILDKDVGKASSASILNSHTSESQLLDTKGVSLPMPTEPITTSQL